MYFSTFQITFETEVTKSHLHPGNVLITLFIFTNLVMKIVILSLYLSWGWENKFHLPCRGKN